ncbi:cupin [Campylobacter sputorum subsp. bubulus]|uniref:Cupin n=1 Tax=Campylobacter sputorum subsp. sputorum TaxID=32024 RepID=A0A381DKB8_9BACT|nr:cupin domain-containing protein [Campylobacter sputorum]ASM34481.1 Cupin domain-containing protein [Campylobacter sputorum aubsp. sputorum RM3237]ASM36146.1 Cupin domain-containing protein [Campylobacter sputorum bv. faecalis CCUG 20703]ASM37829.1 Cupin domain-containing protein [Campylobacter sputorum bv. paraureolyticus LMG 11764]KAB0582132.1 cupin domain-containing protein [Campylobacter sputorum subsp. sputorum]MDY6119872.1 cupin domain-containing protein [Campylobacter sputorum]
MKKISFDVSDFSGVSPTLLLETNSSKEIRLAMQKGSFMKEHKAPFCIMVQVLKGCIEFGVNSEKTTLNQFDLISLEANVSHDLFANEDSIIRLSLSKNDSIDRVKSVL